MVQAGDKKVFCSKEWLNTEYWIHSEAIAVCQTVLGQHQYSNLKLHPVVEVSLKTDT